MNEIKKYRLELKIIMIINVVVDKKLIKKYKKQQAHKNLLIDFYKESKFESTSTTSQQREFVTRTNQLLAQEQTRRVENEKMRQLNDELLERWTCQDSRCFNNNNAFDVIWCFVDYDEKHYNMIESQ